MTPLDLAEMASAALERGMPVASRFFCDSGVPVDFEVSADGSVRMLTPGWEAVVEGGAITAFRPVPVDPVSAMQTGLVGLHEMYLSLRRAGWGILASAAYCAAVVRYNGEDLPGDQG